MATGKRWWLVFRGRKIGVAHSVKKPKGIAKAFPSREAAVSFGRNKLASGFKRRKKHRRNGDPVNVGDRVTATVYGAKKHGEVVSLGRSGTIAFVKWDDTGRTQWMHTVSLFLEKKKRRRLSRDERSFLAQRQGIGDAERESMNPPLHAVFRLKQLVAVQHGSVTAFYDNRGMLIAVSSHTVPELLIPKQTLLAERVLRPTERQIGQILNAIGGSVQVKSQPPEYLLKLAKHGGQSLSNGGRDGVTGVVPRRRLHRDNPLLTILGNPGGDAVQTFSNNVLKLSYRHRFEPESGDVVRTHEFEKGVSMTSLRDGRVVLWRRDGRPVWEDDGQGDDR